MFGFFKVKLCLGLERECMYASHTRANDGYGVPVEKELMKKHFGEKYYLTSKKWSPPLKFVLQNILYGSSRPFHQPFE
jgi:hypothetical protein